MAATDRSTHGAGGWRLQEKRDAISHLDARQQRMLDDNAVARLRNGNFTAIAARTAVPSHRLMGARIVWPPD